MATRVQKNVPLIRAWYLYLMVIIKLLRLVEWSRLFDLFKAFV